MLPACVHEQGQCALQRETTREANSHGGDGGRVSRVKRVRACARARTPREFATHRDAVCAPDSLHVPRFGSCVVLVVDLVANAFSEF